MRRSPLRADRQPSGQSQRSGVHSETPETASGRPPQAFPPRRLQAYSARSDQWRVTRLGGIGRPPVAPLSGSATRTFIAAAAAGSVSAFVKHAVGVALCDAAGWREMLDDALQQTGGPLTKKERTWADALLSPHGQKRVSQKREGGMNGVTFDAGGLIALDRNDRQFSPRKPARQTRLSRVIRQVGTDLIPLDGPDATAVGLLLARTGTADIVDAHVAICAQRAGQTLVTSDADDLRGIADLYRAPTGAIPHIDFAVRKTLHWPPTRGHIQPAESIQKKFTEALDDLVAQVKRTAPSWRRSSAAACRTIPSGPSPISTWCWSPSTTRSWKRPSLALYADGVNVHAFLMPRTEFRKTVEGAVRNSFMHSLAGQGTAALHARRNHRRPLRAAARDRRARHAAATPRRGDRTRCRPSTRRTSGSSRAATWTTPRCGFSTPPRRWRGSR